MMRKILDDQVRIQEFGESGKSLVATSLETRPAND